ncbi:MAG: N-6 DNA methylase, partial [Prevotella sp.]|nr:N-6 DNA methylase [Prevotella sp.]
AVVSNPPYSQQWNPADAEYDARFKEYGVAPKSKADYAFLLHELHHLKPDGILTIVLPHGVLFRGDAEKDTEGEGKIRKNLIEKNNIDAIIGLPANIFFGTGIPTLIMVLKQHRSNDDVLIIDASKGFVKDGKQNKLRACDIKRIADTVRDCKEIPGFSAKVSRDNIRENGYNLNIPRYVDSSEEAVQYDIYATMFGGIPESEIDSLNKYWEALPSLRSELFQNNEDGSPYASVKVENIADAINANADVKSLKESFADAFDGFEDMLHEHLITNVLSVNEMKEQDAIADDIFRRLKPVALVDKYTTYQALANNWQTIVNDIETIQSDGIDAVRAVEQAYKIKKDGDEEIEVPDGLKGRILPFELVQSEKFQSELDAIEQMQTEVDECASELEDAPNGFTEEEAVVYLEDGDGLKLNKKKVTSDAKSKSNDIDSETKVKLKAIVALWDRQSKTNKAIKVAKADLEAKTIEVIKNLTDNEVDEFLHCKWIKPVCKSILDSLNVQLTSLNNSVVNLIIKYNESYLDIESQINKSNHIMAELINQLTGDEYTMKGLNMFVNKLNEDK